MAELRAAGKDPSRGGQAKVRRGQKNQQHMREQAAWEAEHGGEAQPQVFEREILPMLKDVSLAAMARATGLSEQYCSLIRRGKYVPHARHWTMLKVLVDSVERT